RLWRRAEGGNECSAVLDRQPAGGSGADVDQPTAVSQSFRGGERGLQKCETGGSHRGDRGELALDHRLGDVQRRPNIDIRISRARALGIHGSRGVLTCRRTLSDPSWFSHVRGLTEQRKGTPSGTPSGSESTVVAAAAAPAFAISRARR